jgi:hypothetical protein
MSKEEAHKKNKMLIMKYKKNPDELISHANDMS